MENTVIIITQILLLTGIVFISIYVKQLPKMIQEKTLKKIQHSLNERSPKPNYKL